MIDSRLPRVLSLGKVIVSGLAAYAHFPLIAINSLVARVFFGGLKV